METKAAEKRNDINYLSHADTGWLEVLSGQKIPADDPQWQRYMNSLVKKGSLAIDDTLTSEKNDIYFARELFFDQLPRINRSFLNAGYAHKVLPKLDTFINSMRFLDQNQIDILNLCSVAPSVMSFSQGNLQEKLELLEINDIDAPAVINKFPPLIEFSAKSVSEKLNSLLAVGINPADAVNVHPSILCLPPETIKQRAEFYKNIGLNFEEMISRNPRIATFGTKNVQTKLRVMYAAAKSWGVEDYISEVNNFVEQWPTVLTYKAVKLKVLARIASAAIEPMTIDQISLSNLTNSVTANLEATMVAYLQNKSEITKPADIYRLSGRYKVLGNAALKDIIRQHIDDPIVKVYKRGYKLISPEKGLFSAAAKPLSAA